VTAVYSNAKDDDSVTTTPNPLNQPWEISGSATEKVGSPDEWYDYTPIGGNTLIPVANSAGDVFDEDIGIYLPVNEFTLTKNLSAVDWTGYFMIGARNDDDITIWGELFVAGTLRLKAVTFSTKKVRNNISFYTTSYTFEYDDPNTAHAVIKYDRGYNYIDATKKLPIRGNKNERIQKPAWLDGAGGILSIDATPVTPSEVGWAPRADDFSVLNLPSSPE
jgi:hypothetical protein